MPKLHPDTQFAFFPDFQTEAGTILPSPRLAYRTWGKLNSAGNNAIVIFHALSGSANADDWFGPLFGEGKMADPTQHFIVCANVLGSCYGSSNASDPHPDDGLPWGERFPLISIRDMVALQQQLLDQLGVKEVALALGGSMGGMQTLEFCMMDSRAQRAVVMAAGVRHSAWAIGWNHLQRQAIKQDANWNKGQYTGEQQPSDGLSLARQIAMLSYRTFSDYHDKFGRKEQSELVPHSQVPYFQTESYLSYQGRKLVDRFDARSYITLTHALDSHDVLKGRGFVLEKVLEQLKIPVLVIGIDSDLLYPPAEQQELADALPLGELQIIQSKHGHDAFLINFDQILAHFHPFAQRTGLYSLKESKIKKNSTA